MFEKLLPDAVAKFFFDQSTAHSAFADDALNANEMNVRPGGKQWLMHPTTIPNDNANPEFRNKPQTMVFSKDLPESHPDYEFRGQAKGMRRVLEERGLWEELSHLNGGKGIPGDCATCKMTQKEKDKCA